MARKLSRRTRRGLLLLFVAGCLPIAPVSGAEGKVRVLLPPNVVENPFAERGKQPSADSPSAVKLPGSPRQGPLTHLNPFAQESAAQSHQDASVRSGPLSRWRRSVLLPDEPSPVKSAILDPIARDPVVTHETRDAGGIRWNQLPPAELLREQHFERSAMPRSILGRTSTEPPDPVRFASRPLSQPEWLAVEEGSPARQSPAAPARNTLSLVFDPFDAADAAEPEHDDAIVSDFDDSPESCLARAEQAATWAQTTESLTSVVDACQQGLRRSPEQLLNQSLSRLAAWAHNRRGELLSEAGREQEALEDFEAAISLDPECWLALHNRGVTLAQQQNHQAALRDFTRALELNPGLAIGYRNRAELFATVARWEDAIRDYDRAIEQLPDDAELYAARGAIQHRLGDFDRAVADLNESIRLAPGQAEAFALRANLFAEQGKFDAAIGDLQQALDNDSRHIETYRSLAWLLATCPDAQYRDAEQAVVAAERAVRLAGVDDCYLLDALAAAYAGANRFNDAVRAQRQAVRIAEPALADALQQRLALYEQGRPYHAGPMPAVRAASHDAPPRHPSLRARSR
jgi:tetratricopeptide (TPR) repeat protein